MQFVDLNLSEMTDTINNLSDISFGIDNASEKTQSGGFSWGSLWGSSLGGFGPF